MVSPGECWVTGSALALAPRPWAPYWGQRLTDREGVLYEKQQQASLGVLEKPDTGVYNGTGGGW